MALVDYEIDVQDETAMVRTVWQAQEAVGEDYTLFVHVLSEDRLVGQMDAPIGEGLYATGWWREGALVAEERVVPLEPDVDPASVTVNVGFYAPDSGERVGVVGGGDAITLSASGD